MELAPKRVKCATCCIVMTAVLTLLIAALTTVGVSVAYERVIGPAFRRVEDAPRCSTNPSIRTCSISMPRRGLIRYTAGCHTPFVLIHTVSFSKIKLSLDDVS